MERKQNDICIWSMKATLYGKFYQTSCDGSYINYKHGDYCPKCGKKIAILSYLEVNKNE